MLNRKITNNLDIWAQKKKKKCLVVEGPRQVGKTYAINEFISRNYENKFVFYIDLKTYPSIGRIFDKGYDSDRIYQEVKMRFPKKTLEEGKSILFFDNVQLFPKIIATMTQFTRDAKYDVISAGSNMGVIYKNMRRVPVGFIDRMEMNSLDFEEFIWANGYTIDQLKYLIDLSHTEEIEYSIYHDVFIDLFREYMAIGGMPEVVSTYIETRNFKQAYDIQKRIIEDYEADIEVHAKTTMKDKVIAAFNSIPDQLCRKNKKFTFKTVAPNARASTFKSSIEYLYDSHLVLRSNNLTEPTSPLVGKIKENTYKLYVHDPGLLVAMFGEETQLEILKGNILTKEGSVLENTLARMIHDSGKPLYYFETNSTLNVDFIVPINRMATPVIAIEAANPKCKVISSVVQKYDINKGIRLISEPVMGEHKDNYYPVYLSLYLDDLGIVNTEG